MRTIDTLKPELVLLDIQMPELDGFEVLAAVELEPLPYVIFVTAYDHYAVKAFEQGRSTTCSGRSRRTGLTWRSSEPDTS